MSHAAAELQPFEVLPATKSGPDEEAVRCQRCMGHPRREFGIPDPDWGQQIKAVVEPASKVDLDVESLIAFARERLAPFNVPRSIDVVDSIPREASGKLKKHLLRAPYWDAVDTISPNADGL